MTEIKTLAAQYMTAWDLAPAKGDRCSLVIGLTPDQYQSTMRANMPSSDTDGAQILSDVDRLRKSFLYHNPKGVVTVFVFDRANGEVWQKRGVPDSANTQD